VTKLRETRDPTTKLAEMVWDYIRAADHHRLAAGRMEHGRDAQSHAIASGIFLDKARMLEREYHAKVQNRRQLPELRLTQEEQDALAG